MLPVALAAVGLAACGGGGADEAERGTRVGEQEVHPGVLHECAGDWPVPAGMTIVDTSLGRDQAGERTCVVTLRSEATVTEAAVTYLATLDEEGWEHEMQQQDETAAVFDLQGPRCGVMMVVPEQEDTTVFVSLLDCDRVRERPSLPPAPAPTPPAPPPEEQ